MAVVFVNHSSKDDASVTALETWLHANGFTDTFVDHHGIAGGWGLNLDQEVALTPASRLMRFADLPDSYMKTRISERAKPCYDGSIWMTQSYFDVPSAAFVAEVADFPCKKPKYPSTCGTMGKD